MMLIAQWIRRASVPLAATVAALFMAGGIVGTILFANELDQTARRAWIERASVDAERLTEFATLGIAQGEASLRIIAGSLRQVGGVGAEQFIDAAHESLFDAEGVRLEAVAFAPRVLREERFEWETRLGGMLTQFKNIEVPSPDLFEHFPV